MPFSDEERRAWHQEKQRREFRPPFEWKEEPVAVCVRCHNSFGINEGIIADDVALCDLCNGD